MSHRAARRSSGALLFVMRSVMSDMMAVMFGDTHNSFLEFAVHHLLTVGALTALFLPLFGPLMDHHFAERQPGHAHIYLDGPAHKHLHSYETYDHHLTRSTAGSYDDAGQFGAVVILTDTHGLGSGPAGAPAYLRTMADLVLQHGGDTNRFAFSGGSWFPTGAAVPTPKQPPRA